MASRIAGITIEIGGDTTKLQSALKGVQSSLSKTQSELKDVEKLLKFSPTNTELLRQKQKLLADQIKNTKDKLQQLKDAQAQMDADGVDKNSEAYMNLQREIIETESKLKNLQTEARNFGSVGAQQVKAVGEKLQEVGKKVADFGAQWTTHITGPLIALGVVAANSASDYEENVNKINVAFGESADEVLAWAETAAESFGLSQVAATDAVSGFGALGKGIGLTEDEAAEMSTTLAGLAADLGSYFNTSNEDAAKALEGIFTGESEALKKFGVVMNDTNLEQFAKDQGLVWKEMDQAQKTTLRYQYVLSKTADAQGDYSRTSDGTANSIKTLKASLSDVATAIGQELLPIVTPLIQKLTNLIKKFKELSPETKHIIVIIGIIVAAIGPLLIVIGKVSMGIGALMKLAPLLAGPFGIVIAIIAAVVAAGVLLYKNWDTVKEKAGELIAAVSGAWESIKLWTAQTWENIKTSTLEAWENIKTAITSSYSNAKQAVVDTATEIWTSIVTTWETIKTDTAAKWNEIKTSITSKIRAAKTSLTVIATAINTALATAWDAIKTTVGESWDAIKNEIQLKFEAAKTAVTTTVNGIKTTLSTAWTAIKTRAQNGWDSIKSAITSPFESAKNTLSGIVNTIKGFFPINIGKILSNIQLPHFSVQTVEKSFFGKTISIPTIDVQWYRKAMNDAIMLDGASIFGMMGGKMLGGGEAGREVVISYDKLAQMMGGGNNNQTVINVNVNGYTAKDDRALADMVARRIQQKVMQKGAVWA